VETLRARNRRSHGCPLVVRRIGRERKPETFTFLGFIHICGQIRGNKGFIVKRETATKRIRAKLTEVETARAGCERLTRRPCRG
jgi:hypothetical protein